MKLPSSRKTLAISALILILLISVIAFTVNWQEVFDQLRHVNGLFLVVGCAMLIAGYVVYAIRWRVLLSNKPPLGSTFHAANIASMLNTFLPLRPGDAARIFILGKKETTPILSEDLP